MRIERESLLLLAPAIYLFVLPLAHTTALRSVAFGVSVLLLFWTWRAYATPPIPLKAPFAVWLAIALLSLIWAVYPKYSIGEIRSEIVYGILTFLIFFKITRSDREFNFWFVTLTVSAMLTGAFALAHFLRGLDPYHVGVYGGTLHYAAYLNTVFPMLAAFAILRTGWQRMFLVILMVFLLLTAIGSTSRAVWIGFLAELLLFGGLYLRHMGVRPHVRRTAMAASLGVFVLLSAALLYVTKEKRSLTGGPVEIIAQAIKSDRRPQLWIDSLQFIKERPVTGAGFGRMVLSEELVKQQQDRNHSHAHNIFLNYAVQLGLLGPVVLVFLFYSVVRELWGMVKSSNRDLKILGIAGTSIVGGIFIQCMIEDVFVQHMALQFWALMGMSFGYAMNKAGQIPAPAPVVPK